MASLFSALIVSLLLIMSVDAGRWSSQETNGKSFGRFPKKYSSGDKVRVVSHATSYTGKTNYSDVMGMVNLVKQYPLLEEINPDPCLPPVWSWIDCNSDPRPRVIALNLGNRLLFEALPDFSMMDALVSIDLHQTNLYGIIPSFLGDFPDLRELNLANNFFTGQVPDSIACNKNLKLSLDGNYGLYTSSNSCPSGKNTAIPTAGTTPDYSVDGNNYGYTTTTYRRRKSRTPVIVGSTVSVTGVIGIAAGIFAIFRHKAKVAAAVAAANRQGANDEQSNPKLYTEHTGETPLQTRPTNM